MSRPIVLSTSEWDTSAIKFMPPKINDRGGMSINVISTQTNRSLHISTPMMMTWGIADYDDGTGGDGKFNMTLNFPTEDYRKPSTDAFLEKVKSFENEILDQAVKNSELWWGEEMSREVCKHSFFPFLKYQFLKGTKKIDTSKSPSIRAKVPCYDGKWAIELYDTSDKLIFPCENDRVTPPDFVPKLSQVACVLQCGGIWKGGKGWGVTWKVIQSVVKPREVVSVYGKCRVLLSEEDRGAIASQTIQDSDDVESETVFEKATTQAHDVEAEDSDEEQEDEELPEIVAAEVPEPVAPAPPKKKVVKKKVAPVEDTEDVAPAPKKKVVKKKKVVEAEV
jgi:hypothetical protein|tara:strand:- start:372 stop:1379 length:1008 start_codon:yes stop_codon:yes gene_type:complete